MTITADVVIVGGGAIGLSAGTYLAQDGADVLLIEGDQIGQGCSYGNAGLIVPSFSLPMARPGTLRELPQLLLGQDRMVRFRPRLQLGLTRWLLSFLISCRRGKAMATASLLGQMAAVSLREFDDWSHDGDPFGFRRQGWLHVYDTEAGYRGAMEEANLLRDLGVESDLMSGAEVRREEPTLAGKYVGAVFYRGEARLEPFALCQWLGRQLRDSGGRILEGRRVRTLRTGNGRVTSISLGEQEVAAAHYVVAAGSWSGALVENLIGWLPLEPAKGYSLTFHSPPVGPARPLMFGEEHIVVTPFADRLRMTTGLDLVAFEEGVDEERLAALRSAGRSRLEGLAGAGEGEVWFGYRPMTPDGLPIIGPSRRFPNLWLATGHGQLGITLAPATGQLLSAVIGGKDPPMDPSPVSPGRFGL